ncbi:class I SAM-dependent methyltransferase [Ramlibacter sp.]|uniref:class I SAM-dependent methyltransferase n=1 Tax=Ramlibacter sp. TaxID=1917967 RepID=UPI003D0CF008
MATSESLPLCAFCDSSRLSPVMDFGEVALAGAFLTPDQFDGERKFPLRVCFCNDCYAVQVIDKVPADVMFQNYFYFSSSIGTLRNHFKAYAEEVSARFLPAPAASTVLEFGCNDGVLLRPLADQGIRTVIGVDPASNVVATIDDPRVTVVNDYFTEAVAAGIVERHGPVDMIMANNVYAHIPDIQGTTRAIRLALADDGVFVFEVHYLGKVIDELQYDMVYHEHLYYYSLISAIKHFERYGMVVFDVKAVPIHAGSMRFYVCKKESRHAGTVSDAVRSLEAEELAAGFDRHETFTQFSRKVEERRRALMELLATLRSQGKRIAGYGASGRANTMIQYCGIGKDQIDYMVDDAPAKAGFYTPGSHLLIHPSSVLTEGTPPDYVVVFAWSFVNEIRARNKAYLERGGRMILPLPEVSVLPPLPASGILPTN